MSKIEGFLKFVPHSYRPLIKQKIKEAEAKKGYEYVGEIPSVRGSYFGFVRLEQIEDEPVISEPHTFISS